VVSGWKCKVLFPDIDLVIFERIPSMRLHWFAIKLALDSMGFPCWSWCRFPNIVINPSLHKGCSTLAIMIAISENVLSK
jgi:hypothetical protein